MFQSRCNSWPTWYVKGFALVCGAGNRKPSVKCVLQMAVPCQILIVGEFQCKQQRECWTPLTLPPSALGSAR